MIIYSMMKKILIALIIVLSIFLISCAKDKPVACTMDAKICPDGSAVGRVGPNCEFADCPAMICDYNSSIKKYVGKSLDECQRIKFLCENNMEYFSDDCGCGCSAKTEMNLCDATRPQACTMEYLPVCGWFDQSIKCIKYPCASTYGNKCMACANEKVAYWTQGECPK